LFVEYGFIPKGDVAEPLSPDIWQEGCDRFHLPMLGSPDAGRSGGSGYRIEFGPFTVIRDSEDFALILPTPDPSWSSAVRAAGSCFVVLGIGMGLLGGNRVAAPEGSAGFSATFGGSFAEAALDSLSGLHVLPLSTGTYNPLLPYAFVLDTDVLIEIERFCIAPNAQHQRTERTRQLLLNLAYRHTLPGLALAQVYQAGRRSTNPQAATLAAKTVHEVMGWDREQLSSHRSASSTFRSGSLEDFEGTASSAAMLALYAGVLRLRRVWRPSASLTNRAVAFETFVSWIRRDLRLSSPLLIQLAANLLVSSDLAHRQASRLLHFRVGPVNQAALDGLWGTAFDLFLLTAFPSVSLEDEVMEPVLLTFDTGLAQMFDYLTHAGMGPILPEGGPDSPHGFLVAAYTDLHPRLAHLGPKIDKWRAELEHDARERISRGLVLSDRFDEMGALADAEERRLLGADR
jgi:hypothetical protein